MKFHAGKYTIRNFRKSDTLKLYNLSKDEAVKKYVVYAYTETIEEAQKNIECYVQGDCKNDFYLLIEDAEKNEVGVIIAVRTLLGVLDVSSYVKKEYRGQGIMTLVMKSFIRWLKRYTQYTELHMLVSKRNKASNQQLKKLNAEQREHERSTYLYVIRIRE